MSVFRIEKTSNYTIMANYHFKEKEMSLKAKGLLSLMLSLPDDWDYSINGLVSICKENETAIKSALKELQDFGYLEIVKNLPSIENSGRISYEYVVYEKPIAQIQEGKKQDVENLGVEFLCVENPPQLNTNKSNTNNKVNNSIINNTIIAKTKTPFSKLENLEETKKPKKKTLTQKQKNAIRCNQILENFLEYEPPAVQNALKLYVEVRKSKGLQAEQLQIILEEFKKEYNGKPQAIVLEQIRKATAGGWTMLSYKDTFKGIPKVSYGTKPSFDNTINHDIPKGVASMTKEEREYYEEHELARDENGNLIKF